MRRLHWIAELASSLLRNALRRKAQVELTKLSDFTLRRLGFDRRTIPAAADAHSRSVLDPETGDETPVRGSGLNGPEARKPLARL